MSRTSLIAILIGVGLIFWYIVLPMVNLCTYADTAYARILALMASFEVGIYILLFFLGVIAVLHSSGRQIVRTKTGYKRKTLGPVALVIMIVSNSFVFVVCGVTMIAAFETVAYCY